MRGRIKSVRIDLDGKRKHLLRGSRVRTRIDLRGLPRRAYTVRVVVTTTSGERFTEQRRYRTCVPKARRSAAAASRLTGSPVSMTRATYVCRLVQRS